MDFQNFDGDWGPETAMGYVEGCMMPIVEAYDSLLRREPLKKTLKMFRNGSIIFNGSLEADRRAIVKNRQERTNWELWDDAFQYLVGRPYETDLQEQFDIWAQPRRWIWEGGSENKEETARADRQIHFKVEKPRKVNVKIPDGPRKKRYKDGTMEELNYKNGKLHGLCRFYEGKTFMREVRYRNGVRHGLARYWEEEGNIRSVSHFKNDRLDGIDKFYNHETGKVESICVFEKGKIVKVKRGSADNGS